MAAALALIGRDKDVARYADEIIRLAGTNPYAVKFLCSLLYRYKVSNEYATSENIPAEVKREYELEVGQLTLDGEVNDDDGTSSIVFRAALIIALMGLLIGWVSTSFSNTLGVYLAIALFALAVSVQLFGNRLISPATQRG